MENIPYENLDQLESDIKSRVPADILERVQEFIMKNLYQVLGSKFTNCYGKKAIAYIKGRGFAYKVGDMFIGYCASMNKQLDRHIIVGCAIYPISTPLGMIYVECTPERVDCYTGHYFDQYAIRTGLAHSPKDANKMRESVIKTWLQREIADTRTVIHALDYKDKGFTMYKHHPDGMGLGVISENIQLFKTFVSTSMLKKNQVTLSEIMASEPTQLDAIPSERIAELKKHHRLR